MGSASVDPFFYLDNSQTFEYCEINMIPEADARKLMVEYSATFLHQEYRWGGDDPSGFDCSGFVIEIDKSVGLFPHKFDDTAHGLWNRMKNAERTLVAEIEPGDHVFWFSGDRAQHVELAVNRYQTIGASGGGSPQYDVFSEFGADPFLAKHYDHDHLVRLPVVMRIIEDFLKREEAIKRNGFVKIRPMNYRGISIEEIRNFYRVCDPFQMGE